MEQLSSELKEDMNRTQPIPSEQANISWRVGTVSELGW
jgi:hypothetical protein